MSIQSRWSVADTLLAGMRLLDRQRLCAAEPLRNDANADERDKDAMDLEPAIRFFRPEYIEHGPAVSAASAVLSYRSPRRGVQQPACRRDCSSLWF